MTLGRYHHPARPVDADNSRWPAEFERELIRARTGAGRDRAKARGVKFGRPMKLDEFQRREALTRLAAGNPRLTLRDRTGSIRRPFAGWRPRFRRRVGRQRRSFFSFHRFSAFSGVAKERGWRLAPLLHAH